MKILLNTFTGSKEMNYILRCFGPVACRNPTMFVESVISCLKIESRFECERDPAACEQKTLKGLLPQLLYTAKDSSNKQR